MVYAPIWKDTNYTTTLEKLHYRITQNGSVIYDAIAQRMPNEYSLTININKICKDYLRQGFDTILQGGSSMTAPYAYLPFILINADTNATLETYGFLYDWEKGHNWNGGAVTLSIPVNGVYINGQLRPRTTVSSLRVVTNYSTGGAYTTTGCGQYVLYYLNARGGWDAFAYTGKCKRVDNIEVHQFDHSFNNTTTDFEVGRYVSEITPAYELNTGILTEEQAALYARHLISTNMAYLHNLTDGTIVPVVITDNSAEYKLEGADEVITYTTRIKESQKQIKQ